MQCERGWGAYSYIERSSRAAIRWPKLEKRTRGEAWIAAFLEDCHDQGLRLNDLFPDRVLIVWFADVSSGKPPIMAITL